MFRGIDIIVLIGLLLFPSCNGQQPEQAGWLSSQNNVHYLKQSKFSFKLPDLDGNPVSNSDKRFENKVVLFDIWGTWCPPCREMTPFLKELHAKYASKGLEVVGASFELLRDDVEDPKELVAKYVSKNEISYLVLYGGAAEYASSLIFRKLTVFREFDGFPTVVIIARDGTVKRIEEGFNESKAKGIEALVQDLLASK